MHLATNRLWQTTPSSLRRYPSEVTHHVPIIQRLDMSKDATGSLVPSTSSIKPIPVGRGTSVLGYNDPTARYPPGQPHSSVMSRIVSLNPTVATCGSGSDSDSDSDLELESSPVSPHLTPDPGETPASPIDEQALDQLAYAQCLEVLEWFKKQEISTHMEKESIDTFEPSVRGLSVADGYETCQSQSSDDDSLDSTSSFSAGLVRCEECGGCKLDSCEERFEDTTSTESAGSGPATPSTHYSVPRIYVPSATHNSDGSHDDHIPAQTSAPAIPRPSPVNTPLPSPAQRSIDSSSARSVPKVWPASTLDRPSSAYETYIPIYPSSLAIYRKQAIDGLAILSRLANDYEVDCTQPTQWQLALTTIELVRAEFWPAILAADPVARFSHRNYEGIIQRVMQRITNEIYETALELYDTVQPIPMELGAFVRAFHMLCCSLWGQEAEHTVWTKRMVDQVHEIEVVSLERLRRRQVCEGLVI